MKMLSIIVMLIFTVNTIAVAPYGLNGQNQSTTYPNVHQVPNKQVTNLGGINALIETGNNNLLENPSFEHATIQSGWTSAAGTIAAESSIVVHGKKSLKITLSSQVLDLSQNSTLYQAQFADGVQGLAAIKIKTSVAGLRVCAQKAGAVNSNLCVSVKSDNKWGYYKVPFILGGTSNGIEIDSNGVAVTGDVYFDEAFVGAQELTQQINACDSADCTTVFAASINSSGSVSYENVDWISSCTLAGTSSYTCTYKTNLGSLPMSCVASTNGTATDSTAVVSGSTSSTFTVVTKTAGADTARSFMVICERQGSDYTSALYKGVGNTYSSTNADTDWEDCGHTTSSFTGFGTVTNIQTQCKRQGSDLLMKGNFTAGTTTATIAALSLPVWNGVQLSSKNSTIIPFIQMTGMWTANATPSANIDYPLLISASSTVINFGYRVGVSTQALAARNASDIVSAGIVSVNARIPIEGWENSNVIIGQFNGLESCTNTLECTDTFSAKVSNTGVVSEENVDWINGNCSFAGGNSNCTFNSSIFSVAPNCVSSSQVNRFTRSVSSSSSVTTTNYTEAGVADQQAYNLVCQKQGADYIGKTAKAVASDQNLRSIGAIGVDVQSVVFAGAAIGTNCTTSPCIIYNSVGSKITSVTRNSTGDYNVNGIDGTKYICTSNANGSAYISASHRRDLSTSSLARIQYGAAGIGAQDVNNSSVICIGVP